MKSFRQVSVFLSVVFFICCFTAVSFGFNPQPEPPAEETQFVAPQMKKVFDPQPEPPGSAKIVKPGDEVMINPQPEPPGTPMMIDPGDDGKGISGSEMMQEDPEEEPAQMKSRKMMEPLDRR